MSPKKAEDLRPHHDITVICKSTCKDFMQGMYMYMRVANIALLTLSKLPAKCICYCNHRVI